MVISKPTAFSLFQLVWHFVFTWTWQPCSCLSWRWCRELWIVLHTVKSIHSRHALTFTACVDVTCAQLQAYKFPTGFLSTMLKNILEITA